jgi:putative SOS response-associated peptidase YedK
MDGEVSVIQCMKWGLVPSFTGKNEKPDHFRMFNARSESIKEKASFRRLIPNNRCLVAVEGYAQNSCLLLFGTSNYHMLC